MKTYLELKVPIQYDSTWFAELRKALNDISVKWQKGFFHITMVFIDETPKDVDLISIVDKNLKFFAAPSIVFDMLDVFSTKTGMHIVNLTSSKVPDAFLSLIQNIRRELKAAGCLILSDFRLHVTLGRVIDSNVPLSKLDNIIKTIAIPAAKMTLNDIDYREFRGKVLYSTKLKNYS